MGTINGGKKLWEHTKWRSDKCSTAVGPNSLAALHKDASNASVAAITVAGSDVDLHIAIVLPEVPN